jgi:predicted secreted protein
MPVLTIAAIYFILWWTVLFIVLPLGHRSQHEDGAVPLGTAESAPAHFRGVRVVALTTIISAALYLAYYLASAHFGLGIGSVPDIVPRFPAP